MLIGAKKFKIERAAARREDNPVALVLFLFLRNMERRIKIETTEVLIGTKKYPAQPEKIIEKIKQQIVVKRLATGFEYRYYSEQMECDIRVVSDTRRAEDWEINNYR